MRLELIIYIIFCVGIVLMVLLFCLHSFSLSKDMVNLCEDNGGEFVVNTDEPRCFINNKLYVMIKLKAGWKIIGRDS